MLSKAVLRWAVVGFACSLVASVYADESIISSPSATVTKDEYQQLLEVMFTPEQRADLFSNERKLRELLADVYVSKVLAKEAAELGLDKTKQFKLRQEYDTQRQLSQTMLEKLANEAKQPNFEAAAREKYLANKAQFKVPEEVHAEHILIAAGSVREENAAKARAEDVYKKVMKAPADFKQFAKEFSDDPSVKNNSGDLGFFSKDKMVKSFAEAAFALKPGQISAPIKTQFGYHIIHLVEKKAAGQQTFEDVKEPLVEQAKVDFMNDVRRQKVEAIRSASDVKFNPDALRTFIERNVEKK